MAKTDTLQHIDRTHAPQQRQALLRLYKEAPREGHRIDGNIHIASQLLGLGPRHNEQYDSVRIKL